MLATRVAAPCKQTVPWHGTPICVYAQKAADTLSLSVRPPSWEKPTRRECASTATEAGSANKRAGGATASATTSAIVGVAAAADEVAIVTDDDTEIDIDFNYDSLCNSIDEPLWAECSCTQ